MYGFISNAWKLEGDIQRWEQISIQDANKSQNL